jgi:hypothetical protein
MARTVDLCQNLPCYGAGTLATPGTRTQAFLRLLSDHGCLYRAQGRRRPPRCRALEKVGQDVRLAFCLLRRHRRHHTS